MTSDKVWTRFGFANILAEAAERADPRLVSWTASEPDAVALAALSAVPLLGFAITRLVATTLGVWIFIRPFRRTVCPLVVLIGRDWQED